MNGIAWPVEILGRILHFLSLDGASIAWQRLAYLTHKNVDLRNTAERMQRPLVLRVGFNGEREKNFTLPFGKATVAKIEIDWGDDSPSQIINEVGQGYVEHEYKAAGRYTVRVFPDGPGVNGVWLDHLGWKTEPCWVQEPHKDAWWRPLKSLDTLGSLGIRSLEALFFYARLFNRPLSHLDVSRIENMRIMFCFADSFNQDISRWNVSRVQTMQDMFNSASCFNQPIGDWDTSNVRQMSCLFHGCNAFNQDISRWDVSNVRDMSGLFSDALSFNQPIGSWNVSKVQEMSGMFFRAKSFNQPIGEWDVSYVSNMSQMFHGAEDFSQDISAWDVSYVKDTTKMFVGAWNFDKSCVDRWNLSPILRAYAKM